MSIAEALLTAEEYALLPDNGRPTELVRGRIVTMNLPAPRHGQICGKVGRSLGNFAEENDLGHLVANDSGVVTEHDPDTVRGPDVAFYPYTRVPRGPLPPGYLAVVPTLAIEVRSPGDRWSEVLAKVAEYLRAGVGTLCVLDPQTETAHVYQADVPPRQVGRDGTLTFPDVLPSFQVVVRRFFE